MYYSSIYYFFPHLLRVGGPGPHAQPCGLRDGGQLEGVRTVEEQAGAHMNGLVLPGLTQTRRRRRRGVGRGGRGGGRCFVSRRRRIPPRPPPFFAPVRAPLIQVRHPCYLYY
eukprot:1195371-Prorocentrum_minimum.AAC.1